jgi:aldose 1-epimerase
MFSIINKIENGFEKVILRDDNSGTWAEIIPSCGAILHAFSVIQNGQAVNIIDSYDDAEDFNKNVTSKGFLGSKLSPYVCRVNKGRYHFGEKDYRLTKFYLKENAIHGELFDVKFIVTDKVATDQNARVTMKYEYRGTDPGYPFSYDCIIAYELERDNKLNVTTRVENKEGGLIPMQDGWHPYFKLGEKIDELLLEFQSKRLVEFDDNLIPTGKLSPYEKFTSIKKIGDEVLDNCFELNFAECQPMCVLRNSTSKIEVEIIPGESYPYLQIYTPPHRSSIAIENLSSLPDGFNNGIGLKILTPGETAIFKTCYKITLLP